MTTKTLTIDDLDGSENATTVRFGLGDTRYEVDLAEANREKLEQALAPFIQVAREVVRGPTANGQAGIIREWAKTKGLIVPAKGRIPGAITAQYQAEHASAGRLEVNKALRLVGTGSAGDAGHPRCGLAVVSGPAVPGNAPGHWSGAADCGKRHTWPVKATR